ncbi:C1 family peptidase [Lutimonas vermicola]|uniref:C1 family peptidase n=1 Tax=Lutimonas vermicola TaxID=414288 RepID=A0ABU9L242_9FLAO
MRKLFIIFTVFTLLFISCSYDFNDRTAVDRQTSESYETTETQFTTQEAITYFTGCNECTENGDYRFNENKLLENLTIPADLPDEFDLSSFLPPIGNQGRQGSCVSWATTYYLKSFQERIETGLPYSTDRIMSPAYTYNQITQGICEGTDFKSTLDILLNKGAASIESFPYLDYSCNIQPTETQNAEAESNKISDYKYLSGENMALEMKTLLNGQTPILISSFLDSEFGLIDEFGLTAYRAHTVDYSVAGGCHAMLIVGYSDIFNAFKVVNSWGEAWGDDGFVWIDYAAFDNVTDDTADFRVISTAIIAYDL